MVTKKEVLDYYAEKAHRPLDDYWYPPRIIEDVVKLLPEDDGGIYWLADDFSKICPDDGWKLPERYMTFEDVKQSIRDAIDAEIKSLQVIREW